MIYTLQNKTNETSNQPNIRAFINLSANSGSFIYGLISNCLDCYSYEKFKFYMDIQLWNVVRGNMSLTLLLCFAIPLSLKVCPAYVFLLLSVTNCFHFERKKKCPVFSSCLFWNDSKTCAETNYAPDWHLTWTAQFSHEQSWESCEVTKCQTQMRTNTS